MEVESTISPGLRRRTFDRLGVAAKSANNWLGKEVREDVSGRWPHYRDDWARSFGGRILAPAIYVFLASVVAALAFGEQIYDQTGGILTVVHVLVATSVTGLIQAVLGGQPLLIVGVSEPIVLLYGYMYTFGRDRPDLGPALFLAWAAWVCVFAGMMLIILAVVNACSYTTRFTRMAGEIFGMLIAVLFMQEAIRSLIKEFRPVETAGTARTEEANQFQWRLSNGLWALFLAFGTTTAALKVQQARSWRFLTGFIRGILADYGVPLVVIVFSCLSFALTGAPGGVPRRLVLPNTWEVTATWSVTKAMGNVPAPYIAGALIPALMVTILFYFDHTISSQLAQLEEFNLTKPSAYAYDLFLLGFMTIGCGIVGIPPVNGVLPQTPMHTKSLVVLKEQHVLTLIRRVVKSQAGASTEQVLSTIVSECQRTGCDRAASAIATSPSLRHLRDNEGTGTAFDIEREIVSCLPQEAHESRISNFIQSLLVAACLGATPAIKKIPTAVLWGYFAYLAIASLPGSEFWERFLQIFVDPNRRTSEYTTAAATPWLSHVSWKVATTFTIVQIVWTGAVYAITWIPIAGIVFPIPILLLIPIRQMLLPRLFGARNLALLDPAKYEDNDSTVETDEASAA